MSLTKPQLDMINTGGSVNFRNKIIGGDFSLNPWQRGTSFAAHVTGTYGADRWYINNTSSAVITTSKATDAPTIDQAEVFTQHSYSAAITTADATIAAGDTTVIDQPIEGYNCSSFGFGQTGTRYVTLSFWVKSSITGTYCVAFRNGAATRSYVSEYSVLVSNTWEKKTITVPVDTSGTWLYDNGIGLIIRFALAAGTTFQAPAANTWYGATYTGTANQVNFLGTIGNTFKIALVQLEAGSVATPFEQRPFGFEVQLCQRYYEKSYDIGVVPGTISNSGVEGTRRSGSESTTVFDRTFMVEKRTTPSIVWYNPNTGASGSIYNTSGATNITVTGVNSVFTTSTKKLGSPTHVAEGSIQQTIAGHWTAEAEL